MPGRGPQTFKKRQKEQERKERQQEKMAKRLQRKAERGTGGDQSDIEAVENHDGVDQDGVERNGGDPSGLPSGVTAADGLEQNR